MRELHATFIELGWRINDIFSWNVEQVSISHFPTGGYIADASMRQRSGDMCNLISLIMIHEQKSVQDSINDVEEEFRSQLLKWRSAKMKVIQTYQSHHDIEDLKSLIEGNEVWIWTAVVWS
jgi:hypothetical protein